MQPGISLENEKFSNADFATGSFGHKFEMLTNIKLLGLKVIFF